MIEIQQFGQEGLPAMRQVLIDIHADAYADAMDDPFNQRFPWFVDHWGSNPGFACAVAYDGGAPAGFCYGAPAKPDREWWREHWSPPGGDASTFAVSELMIRKSWRKGGLSSRLHDELLATRPEALAVLLVDLAHPKVQKLYESWGYEKVGTRQPFADSPIYAVMVKQLRPAQP
jgi:hypothetical protein